MILYSILPALALDALLVDHRRGIYGCYNGLRYDPAKASPRSGSANISGGLDRLRIGAAAIRFSTPHIDVLGQVKKTISKLMQ